MKEKITLARSMGTVTRRQMVAGLALTLGGGLACSYIWAAEKGQTMNQIPATEANAMRTSLHYEVDFKVSPQRIYDVLLSAKEFAAFTGLPAEIDGKAGGAFSLFGGQIAGRNVELVPSQRIVQAWRPAHWDPGIYSIVKFELKPRGSDAKAGTCTIWMGWRSTSVD
jgi:activator of HSP90 ATPase